MQRERTLTVGTDSQAVWMSGCCGCFVRQHASAASDQLTSQPANNRNRDVAYELYMSRPRGPSSLHVHPRLRGMQEATVCKGKSTRNMPATFPQPSSKDAGWAQCLAVRALAGCTGQPAHLRAAKCLRIGGETFAAARKKNADTSGAMLHRAMVIYMHGRVGGEWVESGWGVGCLGLICCTSTWAVLQLSAVGQPAPATPNLGEVAHPSMNTLAATSLRPISISIAAL